MRLYLRQVWLIVTTEEICPGQRTIRLMREMRRFETGLAWKRLKHHSAPPEDLSQLRKLLFRVLKTGRAPGFRQLQQICETGILNQDFVGVRTPQARSPTMRRGFFRAGLSGL